MLAVSIWTKPSATFTPHFKDNSTMAYNNIYIICHSYFRFCKAACMNIQPIVLYNYWCTKQKSFFVHVYCLFIQFLIKLGQVCVNCFLFNIWNLEKNKNIFTLISCQTKVLPIPQTSF